VFINNILEAFSFLTSSAATGLVRLFLKDIFHADYVFKEFIFILYVTAKVKQGANIVLVVLMLMAVYSHYMVNDKFERTAPALVSKFCINRPILSFLKINKKVRLEPCMIYYYCLAMTKLCGW
jgi:hypothetical protein